MLSLESIAAKGTEAVKRLRREQLTEGFSFMINDDGLPSGQCYLEQPDGSVQLVELATNGRDFDSVRELSAQESDNLRAKYGLTG